MNLNVQEEVISAKRYTHIQENNRLKSSIDSKAFDSFDIENSNRYHTTTREIKI